MQTSENGNEAQGNEPKVRTLKIQEKIRFNRYDNRNRSPEIKLCGNWLAKLGFHCNKRVSITTSDGLLIVKLIDESNTENG